MMINIQDATALFSFAKIITQMHGGNSMDLELRTLVIGTLRCEPLTEVRIFYRRPNTACSLASSVTFRSTC